MQSERIYNIALDRFMEEKVKLMQQFKKFPKQLYYNQKDKEYLLYELDPTLAKQVWEKLKCNIYTEGVEWLSAATCPFCIEAKIRCGDKNIYICDFCAYKKNHRNISCMSLRSDLYEITNARLFNIKNSEYIDIISNISKELFNKSYDKEELFNNVNNLKEFTIDYDNFKVIVRENYKKNKINKFSDDALYSQYDFTRCCSRDEIISADDVEDVDNREFENVDPKIVKMIFELAEKCKIDDNNHGVRYNFIVYSNGEIRINYNMKRIKDSLEEIKKEYDEYLKNKARSSIVKIEVKN